MAYKNTYISASNKYGYIGYSSGAHFVVPQIENLCILSIEPSKNIYINHFNSGKQTFRHFVNKILTLSIYRIKCSMVQIHNECQGLK